MNKLAMYSTSFVLGASLCFIANYCGVPWPWRFTAYFVMGAVIGWVWKS